MIPILTAVIGAVVVITGAFVARNATHYAAELQAVQHRRDAELQDLLEFRDALVDALHALGEYLFVLRHMVLPHEPAFERIGDTSPDVERRMRHLLPLIGKRDATAQQGALTGPFGEVVANGFLPKVSQS